MKMITSCDASASDLSNLITARDSSTGNKRRFFKEVIIACDKFISMRNLNVIAGDPRGAYT